MQENFNEIYLAHKDYVTRVAGSLCRKRRDIDPEDICQEVFLRAFAGLSSFKEACSFRTWITRITVNTCFNYLRKKQYKNESIEDVELSIEDHQLRSTGARHDISMMLENLSPKRRKAVELFYLQGMTSDEVALQMGLTKAAAKSQIYCGKMALKEQASVQ
jgi:RNA polymerase sigma-70 factor (ECF subfamily)